MTLRNKPCPICKKPRSTANAPFCSVRCKDRDLVKWFGDGYSVPGPAASSDQLGGDDWEQDQ